MVLLQSIPTWILVGIVCVFLSLFTEFTSNVAVVSIVMPVLAEMVLQLFDVLCASMPARCQAANSHCFTFRHLL